MQGHNHDDKHGSHHHHRMALNGDPLKRALLVTAVFMVVEILGGYYTHSLALISDGIHMLTDAAAMGMSLIALYVTRKPANLKRSFGFYRVEILAAFANGVILMGLSCFIILDSWNRLQNPVQIKSVETFFIALAGLAFNLYSVSVLLKADRKNLNIRGVLFHVFGDLLGSVGAMASALAAYFFGWYQADPVASILIGVLIIVSAWRLVSDTVNVMLEAAPSHIDVDDVQHKLSQLPGVDEVHDLHVWCITSEIVSLSAHIVSKLESTQELLLQIRETLEKNFNITHVTIQIERESLRKSEPHI